MAQSYRKALIEQVITQIESDINVGDYTAIDELLAGVPVNKLAAYLPEEDAVELAAKFNIKNFFEIN